MPWPRRCFLKSLLSTLALRPLLAAADDWQTIELTTHVEIARVAGPTRVWLPLPYAGGPDYQRVLKQSWRGNAPVLRAVRDERVHAGVLLAEFPSTVTRPEVLLTVTVATRDRSVNWLEPAKPAPPATLRPFLQATTKRPVDGIVRSTARRITARESEEVSRARAIYEWLVEEVAWDPSAGGAGSGDVRRLLETEDRRGTSLDINGSFVALARAAGVPARAIYGVRVPDAATIVPVDVSDGQYCRAEFYSARHGWVPVDPARVRERMHAIPGADLAHPEVQYLRRQLFGTWRMDWVALSDADDVTLPNAKQAPLPFLLYPQAESGGRYVDSTDPDAFRYRITARRLSNSTAR